MATRVVMAVAGSGKTSHIIDSIQSSERSLILTYTIGNCENLKRRVIEKYGCIPNHIRIERYFSFLLSFFVRPFLGE